MCISELGMSLKMDMSENQLGFGQVVEKIFFEFECCDNISLRMLIWNFRYYDVIYHFCIFCGVSDVIMHRWTNVFGI